MGAPHGMGSLILQELRREAPVIGGQNTGFRRLGRMRVIHDDQVVSRSQIRQRGIRESLQRPFLPGNANPWIQLLEPLPRSHHGNKAPGVVPGDAAQLNHGVV